MGKKSPESSSAEQDNARKLRGSLGFATDATEEGVSQVMSENNDRELRDIKSNEFENRENDEEFGFDQKLEWIRSLELIFEDKLSLLLVLKGIRPACIISEVNVKPLDLFSKIEEAETRMLPTEEQIEYLKSIGASISSHGLARAREANIKEKGTIVAMTKEILDGLEQARKQLKEINNPRHPKYHETHYTIGKLLGLPESCLANEDHTTDDKIHVPDHLKPLKCFLVSKDHWEEELRILEDWFEQIKDLIPKIK